MPATSRSGDCFCRRSASGARGLALEIDDHEVVLRDQHLAEVVVAVAAGLQRRRRPAAPSVVDAREQALALREQRLRLVARAARAACRDAARSSVERAAASSRARAFHAATSAAVSGSGSNAGSPELGASARCSSAVRMAERR